MKKSVLQFSASNPWTTALVFTGILFLLFNIVATPLLNSDDDAFLLYTLAGAFGDEPTALLHYNHVFHPWIGTIISALFKVSPGVNWYSIFLSLLHVAGLASIFYVLLKRLRPALAFFFYLLLFFFIETRMLLSFTFTGASLVAAIGSCALLVHVIQHKGKTGTIIFAMCLLLLAGLVRLQVAGLVIILFGPLVLTLLAKKEILRLIGLSGIVVVLLLCLNMLHRNYYIKHIDGWKEQEKFRQGLFYVYNRQLNEVPISAFGDSTERELYNAGFLYDSSKFTAARVNEIAKTITRKRSFGSKEDRAGFYWFFMEVRVYIVLFGILVISLLVNRQYSVVKKWMLSFLLVLGLHAYLFIFLKITLALHLGILMILLLHLALHLKRDSPLFIQNKTMTIATGLVFVLLFGWMGRRVAIENGQNIVKRHQFRCLMSELNRDPEKVFVATGFASPIDDFYIWDNPSQYPAKNILYKERLLTHTYLHTLKRLGISDLKDALLNNKHVYLWGKPLQALLPGYPQGTVIRKIPGYSCTEIYHLSKE